MAKRLLIDLEKCNKRQKPECNCSYFYHPFNDGVLNLREYATFATICRQCEEAPCVKSCPKDALEKQEEGVLRRYNARCVSCKSCVFACPFGTIVPEIVPYFASRCDGCIGRSDIKNPPVCTKTCPEGAIRFEDVEESKEKNIVFVGELLAVHCIQWRK